MFQPLMVGRATIFMLHRFDCPEVGVHGHNLGFLRSALQYLRDKRYELMSLRELYTRLSQGGETVHKAVAFTIDDGYFDHADVAAPIFAEYGCPVTTFVTTGFLDGQLWFWWDQIEHIFESAKRSNFTVSMGDTRVQYAMVTPGMAKQSHDAFTHWCKTLKAEERQVAIAQLAMAAEVELPRRPPPRYAPMTWDALRSAEKKGMEFGPHTVTHPILTQSSDDQAKIEISQSWEKLSKEAHRPVPIFCYPNGQWSDFSDREIHAVRAAGMVGAVSGEPGYFNCRTLLHDQDERYKVRRFAFPDDMADLVQVVSGIERAKQVLRGEP
ncbi:MAG: polysaccharide deacetylase family protein [Nitrospiraceae bacterium]